MKFNNLWVRFGCFLTGYNYNILSNCSEVSAKAVKKYTAAMLIICIIWAFVGFTFTQRYLGADYIGSTIGAFIMVLIIVQVERQIILAVHKHIGLAISRTGIAIIMALIGSLIIDQIIFKEDIEQQKLLMIDDKINKVLPGRSAELKRQINELDSAILAKEIERKKLSDDVAKSPTIRIYSSNTVAIPVTNIKTDSVNGSVSTTSIQKATNTSVSSIPNPNIVLIDGIDKFIADLRVQKSSKDSAMLLLRPSIERELKSSNGFLDELNVMFSLLSESPIVLGVWILWILFLFGLELLVLIGKMFDKENDYDHMIKHQMDIHIKKIGLLANQKI